MEKSQRFHQLDALRGIAAVMVVFSHFAQLAPMEWIWHTPLRLLAGGREAVLLFFVLSGFALTLQLNGRRKLSYGAFVWKRILRIYVPYLAVFLLSAACVALAYTGSVNWSPGWMNDMWSGPLSLADYGNQIFFLGDYHSEKADPVVWSLIYEMRISLIFPIIVAVLIRPSSVITLLIALLLSIASFIWLVREGGDPGSANFEGSGIMTFHYIAFFMIGALLALRRDDWMPWLRQGKRAHWILALSLIAYFFTRRALFGHNGAGAAFLFDWLVAVGTVGIIATSIVSRQISAVLEHKAALFLGKISFSLYLTHLVVLLTVSHLMPKATEGNAAMILSAVMILPVALITYYLIERPSMRLAQGKRPVTLVEHKV